MIQSQIRDLTLDAGSSRPFPPDHQLPFRVIGSNLRKCRDKEIEALLFSKAPDTDHDRRTLAARLPWRELDGVGHDQRARSMLLWQTGNAPYRLHHDRVGARIQARQR